MQPPLLQPMHFKVILLTGFVTLLCPGSAVPHKKLIDQIAMESDISAAQAVSVLPPSSMKNPPAYTGFKINPTCQCGVSPYKDTQGNQHPWTAAVFYRYRESPESKPTMMLFCTGSLINDRYVLTASRCVQGLNASDLQVWLSEKQVWSDQKSEEQDLKKTPVEKIIIHPDFDSGILNHEIALLKLSDPVKLSPPFQPSNDESSSKKRKRHRRSKGNARAANTNKVFTPVCLPKYDMLAQHINESGTYLDSMQGTVVSWDKKGRTSYSLIKTQVPLVNGVSKCAEMINQTSEINENMFCAGQMEKGVKDSCSMDTGSPLVLFENTGRKARGKSSRRRVASEDNKGHYTLVGISSWLYGCTNLENVRLLYDVIFPNNTAKPQVPGVYTRVEKYRDWITHNTLDAVWCA